MAHGTNAYHELTDRQLACLRLAALHLKSTQIADRLSISPNTVDNHIKLAVERLGASGRRDAVRRLAEVDPETSQILTSLASVIGDRRQSDPTLPAVPSSDGAAAHDRQPNGVMKGVSDDVPNNLVKTAALVGLIAFVIAMLLIALDPIVQSAARLADTIQPHRH